MTYYVAVHGGAGFFPTEQDKEVRKVLRRACGKALDLLKNGRKATEVVESAIVVLEDSECLNAGYGANLTRVGTVECDAAIMDDSGRFGSVGAVSNIKNPIRAAKAILDYSCKQHPLGLVPPLTLVSQGAQSFANNFNVPTTDPKAMISPRAREEWKFWTSKLRGDISKDTKPPELASSDKLMQDTVGAVALDTFGSSAAGVSSGGLLLKWPGRVGEAATFGAGCWAQKFPKNSVASSVSGTGEAIMRAFLARSLSEVIFLDDSHERLRDILEYEFSQIFTGVESPTASAGAILLVKETRDDGTTVARLWCAFNTESMAIAYASSEDPQPKSVILRQPESHFPSTTRKVYLTVLP